MSSVFIALFKGRARITPRYRAMGLAAVLAASGCSPSPGAEGRPEGAGEARAAVEEQPSWTPVGSMSIARQEASATRLLDGRVILIGGMRIGSVDVGDVFLETAEIWSPKTGKFSSVTAKMAQKRVDNAAVLMANGDVLVAGGAGSAMSATTAEVFHPNSGTWTSTPPLAHEHLGATLTALASGRVLLAGGSPSALGGLAEIFDPALGTWTDAPSMSTARRHHTGTRLPDGRVLVTGGEVKDGDSKAVAKSAEIYDPATNTWSAAASMSIARVWHTATLVDDGTVFVVGGRTASGEIVGSVERYDPAQDKWTKMPSLVSARELHTATLLDNGALLVAGGLDATFSALRSSELFDRSAGSWVSTGLLNHGRNRHMAALVEGGSVLVAGGELQSSAEIYRPAELGQPCEVATQCGSGRCVDGVCCNKPCTSLCHTCALPGSEGQCSPVTPGTDPRQDCGGGGPCDSVCDEMGACSFDVGRVCAAPACSPDGRQAMREATCEVMGAACSQVIVDCAPYRCGESGTPAVAGCLTSCRSIDDCAEGYACDTEGACRAPPDVAATFEDSCAASPGAPGGLRSTVAAIGVALLAAAARRRRRKARGVFLAATVASSMTLSSVASAEGTGSMSTPRWLHVVAGLADGRVLVAGGRSEANASTTAEIYDPATGKWTPTAPMLFDHDWPVGAALCDGRVLVAGKYIGETRTAEIYDPATNQWTDAGLMKYAHVFGTATLMQNCRILIVGGYSANTLAEAYNPETGVFKGAGSMTTERFFHTATLLADGRVLVAGGGVPINGTWFTYSTVEIYNPEGSAWKKAKGMHKARRSHTATLLADGRVLVTGGTTGGKDDGTEAGTQLSSAEIYDPALDSWEEVPSTLVTARAFHTAALMPGGAVLFFGGLDESGSATSRVEGYMGDAFHALDPLLVDRYQHASAALGDGAVLVMGGFHQATAEIYRLAPKGALCESNLACEGGHCVDGRCCDDACFGGCRRCDVPGKEGICSLPCADATHALVCADGTTTCADDACVARGCGRFRCDGEAGACLTKCKSVEDCGPGYACNLEGKCVRPPDVQSADDGSCSAGAAGPSPRAAGIAGVALAVAALVRRRARRRGAPL